ncbi:coiled-coil domain-containing protein AGAP005037 isoform X5 [Periplaneta americana]|uniref:coiled-coil domain-containing protein AGAP005037 isoform X5 n=1 Tax=Periplaneta americana TaxID=6978 RepID=UPI0037E7A1A5
MCSNCSECCHNARRSERGKNDDAESDEQDELESCSEEEWGADGKARGPSGTDQSVSNVGRDDEVRRGGGGGGRSGRRDEPRRHTLSGDHHHHQQGGALARSMDLEMSSKSQRRKSPLPRGYPPPSSAMLFDEDPGIMSEVETSSTGFRRGGKQRSSLPVVRTPSKTLERPLGKTSGGGVPIGVGPMLRISPHPSAMATHHHQMVQLLNHHHGLSNKQSSATAPSGGLVFLQYRSETKRALLPNEITSIDTVKALFVRSFPKQLTMEYLDSPHVKIYIHDSSKDMFYELEDLRSHLRDIRDRSVLRLFESTDMNGGVLPGAGVGVVAPPMWDQDQSYFSEPEFDSEYQHQHIHKTKASSKSGSGGGVPQQAPYYMTHSYPPGGSQGAPGASATLPRGGPLLRAYSPAVAPPVPADRIKTLPQTGIQPPPKPVRTYQQGLGTLLVKGTAAGGSQTSKQPYSRSNVPTLERKGDSGSNIFSSKDRLHAESGYMSSPERGGPRAYPAAAYPPGGPGYEDPYYSQYASRSGSITPVIDEEASDTELIDESYSLYGVKLPTAGPGRSVVTPQPRSQFPAPAVVPYDATRIRVEHMERQLANLTGLVQKALTQTPTPREYLQVPPPASSRDANYRNAASDEYDKHSSSSSASLPDDSYLRTDTKPPKLGKDKSVSFEKSVSFSDEPPDMNSPKQHSPQHAADSKPPKPAIKSSTLPRMSSQERTERDRHKPAPPPKPVSLSPGQYEGRHVYRDMQLTPEMYNQLRGLQKKAKDLRQEVRNLRRMSQAQAHSVRETIRDTFMKIRAMLLIGGEEAWAIAGDADKVRLNREEDSYKQEMLRLEKDLTELESTVEELRGNVINRKTRVNMSDVENMALILSKSSKTVADLKVRFPSLQEGMKGLLASEMEKVVREEKFLKEEPERLESALRRCKKLTGTLVTLKRLASVQEQRLPPSATPESRLSPTMGLGGDSDTPITPPAHGKPSAVPARGVMAATVGGDASTARQRPENALDALLDELQTFARPPSRAGGGGHNPPMADIGRKGSIDSAHPHAPSLPSSTGTSSLRRLHSYPSSSDGGGNSPPTVALSRLQVSGSTGADAPKSPATSPKPPVPERNSELLSHLAGRRVPPPPPPRTSSRSPLASPTSPSLPPRGQHPPSQPQMGVGGGTLLRRGGPGRSSLREPLRGTAGISVAPTKQEESGQLLAQPGFNPLSASNSSSCESINSQEGLQQQQSKSAATGTATGNKARQEILEQRHQELLRKQRALQEQYARLQQLQRGGGGGLAVVPPPDLLLKKTGSESNLLAKMGLGHGLSAAAPISGSLTHLAAVAASANQQPIMAQQQMAPASTAASTTITSTQPATSATTTTTTTTNKIYETDIL